MQLLSDENKKIHLFIPVILFVLLFLFVMLSSEYSEANKSYLFIGNITIYNPYALILLLLFYVFSGSMFLFKRLENIPSTVKTESNPLNILFVGNDSLVTIFLVLTFVLNIILSFTEQGFLAVIFITLISIIAMMLGSYIKKSCDITYGRWKVWYILWLFAIAILANITIFTLCKVCIE